MSTSTDSALRFCLRDPIIEIEEAAELLAQAVEAHMSDRREIARSFLVRANLSVVRDWTESIWGKQSRFAPTGPYWSRLVAVEPTAARMPNATEQAALHARDGFYCRFCRIPLVRKQVRERLRVLYPGVPIWGRKNSEQHASLQAMWAQYDHLRPHSRGGTNDLSNLVVTCGPCNYGRMQYTLEEARLLNPLDRPPRIGIWRGLEALLSH